MSTPTISTKIALEGEKEYKAAVSGVNNSLRELKSEMSKTKAQFEENADSVEALSASSGVLEKTQAALAEKIRLIEDALKNASDSFGETDKRTVNWRVSLNNAQAELFKLDRELAANREALQKSSEEAQKGGDKFEGLADSITDTGPSFGNLSGVVEGLADKFGIDLPDGAKQALDALGNLDGKTLSLAGGFAALAAAVVEVEKKLMDLTTERAEYAAGLDNLAKTIGMNVRATQEWDYVLKTVGSSIDEAQGDLSAFQEKIKEASTFTGEASELFLQLGVNVTDQNGALRDTEAVLMDTVIALQHMTNETERNAISSQLLGGTGEKLIPIYSKTAEELGNLFDRKREIGYITAEEIEVLKGVSAALVDFQEYTADAGNSIAVEFAPALEAFYLIAGETVAELGRVAADSGLVNFFGTILELLTATLPLFDALGALLEGLGPVVDVFSVALGFLADALMVITQSIAAIFKLFGGDWEGMLDSFSAIGSIFTGDSATVRAVKGTTMYSDMAKTYGYPTNAAGSYNFPGGMTWVGENGPEPVWLPQGSRIGTAQDGRSIGGDTFYVTISARDVKEFNDIVRIAQSQRRTARMEGRNGDY